MKLRQVLNRLFMRATTQGGPLAPSPRWTGRRGEMTLAEDMRVGAFVVKRGSYVLSQRLEEGASVLVLTAVAQGNDDVPDSSPVVATRQVVTRSSVFAEELNDGSLRVRIAQIAVE